jgi:citrate lyase gamma subunit
LKAKTYKYNAVIQPSDKGGAYVAFPYDVRAEFGKGRAKVHATFDGEPYNGSVVNMGVKNIDGSVCYIIGIRKDIRAKIGKQVGDTIRVTIQEREALNG